MDFKKLTYRSKLKLLPLAIVLVFVLVYSLTISKTVHLSKQVGQLENQVERLGGAPLQIQMLKKRLKEIEDRIGNHSGEISQEEIFRKLSIYSKKNGLIVREFPIPHNLSTEDYQVSTYQMEVEGKYANLLRMVYYLEKETYLGKLAGLHFLLKKDKRSREEYLSLKIFLQTVN